jgi:hypothetical protein
MTNTHPKETHTGQIQQTNIVNQQLALGSPFGSTVHMKQLQLSEAAQDRRLAQHQQAASSPGICVI